VSQRCGPCVGIGAQSAVSTSLKGSQFHQYKGNQVFKSLIGGDAVKTLQRTLQFQFFLPGAALPSENLVDAKLFLLNPVRGGEISANAWAS
jgi:hypothetical protein